MDSFSCLLISLAQSYIGKITKILHMVEYHVDLQCDIDIHFLFASPNWSIDCLGIEVRLQPDSVASVDDLKCAKYIESTTIKITRIGPLCARMHKTISYLIIAAQSVHMWRACNRTNRCKDVDSRQKLHTTYFLRVADFSHCISVTRRLLHICRIAF